MKAMKFMILAMTVWALKSQAQVTLENPHIFIPPKGATSTAGYVTIKNAGDKDVTVNFVAAAGFKKVEAHETMEMGGNMSMHMTEALTVKAKSSLELKPGGYHIMMFDPAKPLKAGQMVKVTYKVDGKTEFKDFKLVTRQAGAPEAHHSM
jgi:copper(I)-binding protein